MPRFEDLDPETQTFFTNFQCRDDGIPPWTPLSKPLAQCTVAIVTSSGLMRKSDQPFDLSKPKGDPSFRKVPSNAAAQELKFSHVSTNWDRTGFAVDINVIYPIDRLRELAAEGAVGNVAPYFYSFTGAIFDVTPLIETSGPNVGRQLRDDGVDVAILVPTCPLCPHTMAVVQREIEACGVSTVSLSLYRPFTEIVKPPRALWVPFPFGRPLGEPGNATIQHRVLRAALDLLRRPQGPVLEEFSLSDAEDHLDARYQSFGSSCGPNGCRIDQNTLQSQETRINPESFQYVGDLAGVREELGALAKHQLNYMNERGGRTQVVHSCILPENIGQAALFMHQFVNGQTIAVPSSIAITGDDAQSRQNLFVRLCADDLKAFCLEARIGQGLTAHHNASAYNDWFWLQTKTGGLIRAARDRVVATTNRELDPNWMLARAMVPRGYGESGYPMSAYQVVDVG